MKDNGLMLFIELVPLAADPSPCIPPIINALFVLVVVLLLVAILLDCEANDMRSLRFIGTRIVVTVTRCGGSDDDIIVLAFKLLPAVIAVELGVVAKCLKVTDISLFSRRFIDVTLTPLTILIPTEPYRDDALSMLFAKLRGLKSVPASPPFPMLILLSPIIGCANVA